MKYALCDINAGIGSKAEKLKSQKVYEKRVAKGKMDTGSMQMPFLAKITPGVKEDICTDCDLIVEAAFENMEIKKTDIQRIDRISVKPECYLCYKYIFIFQSQKSVHGLDSSNDRYAFLQPGCLL